MLRAVSDIVKWIQNYFSDEQTKAVIGMSGGKDSTIAAALLCKALGPDRVIAVRLPAGDTTDDRAALGIINYLGITQSYRFDITEVCNSMYLALDGEEPNAVVTSNLPARVRMTLLYAIANQHHGRVINTSNRSEWYVGYTTKYGDSAGDISLFRDLTYTDVIDLGRELELPEEWITKPPTDGLCGKTDEENLGFSYADVDAVLRHDPRVPANIAEAIAKRHEATAHKRTPMPVYH